MAHLLTNMAPESPEKVNLNVTNSEAQLGPMPCPLATIYLAMNFPPPPARSLGPPLQATFYHHGYRGPNPTFCPRMAPYIGPSAPTNPLLTMPVNTQPVFSQCPPPFPGYYPIRGLPAPYPPQKHTALVASKKVSGSENRGRRRTRNIRGQEIRH